MSPVKAVWPFWLLAPGVWWLFSAPRRLFEALFTALGWVLATDVGRVVVLVVAVLVAAGLLVRRSAGAIGYGCHHCAYRSMSTRDIAKHEAGHYVVAEALGHQVHGAEVWPGEGGITWVNDGRTPLPDQDQVVISAAGAAGENVGRWFFREPLNGAKSDPESDAGKAHRIAPGLAAQQGITPAQVIERAEDQASRIIQANRGRWEHITAQLEEHRIYGKRRAA